MVRVHAPARVLLLGTPAVIAGIDLSSFAVDVVLLEDDTDAATWHRFELAGPTAFERARSLRAVFPTRSFWEDHGVWLLGIEDPHSRFPHAAKALGMATGAVAALLPRDLTVIQTAPKEWKRIFTDASNSDKQTVANVARYYHRFKADDFNATDAYGIAWAVRHLNQQALDAA